MRRRRCQTVGESRRHQLAPDDRSARGGEILRCQGHCPPSTGRRGSKIPFPVMRLSGDLIVRYLDAIELRRWLARSGGEKNPRPPIGRYLHDVSQVLVGAIHKQSVQVDLGRFGAELAALLDETL